MKKYNVAVEFLYHTYVKVEAESAEEAMMIAEDMSCEELVGKESIYSSDLEDPGVTDVYDSDWKHIISC